MAGFSFPSGIDQIIAGGAGASSRANIPDFSQFLDAYYKGRDEKYQQQGRDLFQGGIPTDASGQPDFSAMSKALFQHGDVGQGVALSNLDIQRKQLAAGQDVADKLGNLESGGNMGPPSANRNAAAPVAQPLNRGGLNNTGGGNSAPSGGGSTITQIVAASGIPNDQVQAASASVARQLGVDDPNSPIDTNDPRVRNVLVPAIQQLKRAGIGQVIPAGAPAPAPQNLPPVAQTAPQPAAPAPAPNPQQNQGTFGPAPDTPTRGAVPTGMDPEDQKRAAIYTAIAANPAYPQSVREAAQTRLKALQDQMSPTPDIKNYDLYRRQGGNLPFNDWLADVEQRKAAGTEEAKVSSQKYQTLVDVGVKAQQEIPQLEMLQNQMQDPNFYSGAGEKYNLMFKRLKAAVGIDPDAAVPQEFLRKATAASVLGSFGALKGMGPIRVAEMNLAKQAAAAPENSIPANKLLVEIQKRTYQRQADIAEMAQEYKDKNGVLDPGFDKQVTAYFKSHPIFTDAEIADYHKAINEAPKTASAQPPIEGARQAPDGNWYVSDPKRPGKYLKVVQ